LEQRGLPGAGLADHIHVLPAVFFFNAKNPLIAAKVAFADKRRACLLMVNHNNLIIP